VFGNKSFTFAYENMKQKWRNIFREIFASIPWGSSSACDNKKIQQTISLDLKDKESCFF